ncbi:MAG: hypothetical protein ACN4E6_01455 [Qipengyuania pacifica]
MARVGGVKMKRRNSALSERHAAATKLQDGRRDELADLRLQRRLTDAELEEEARLERALALRIWREEQAVQEARIAKSIAAQRKAA